MINAEKAIELLDRHDTLSEIVKDKYFGGDHQIYYSLSAPQAKDIADLISRQQAVCDATRKVIGYHDEGYYYLLRVDNLLRDALRRLEVES